MIAPIMDTVVQSRPDFTAAYSIVKLAILLPFQRGCEGLIMGIVVQSWPDLTILELI